MSDRFEKPLVHALGISKVFENGPQRVELFHDLELIVRRGERIAIVGVSGVGKSTLLHILGTLERPTSGKVLHGGHDILQWDETKLARYRNQHLGFVFQFHYLLPEFSALENVMMCGLIAGLSKKKAAARAEQLLVQLGLKERLTHRPSELSGGEQQRVAIARAIFLEPDLLLADEPSGNLDTYNARKLHELLVSLNETNNLTMIVATHNRELASMMHRTLELSEGSLREVHRW